MGRKRECKSCIFFKYVIEKLQSTSLTTSLMYDGWCEEDEEERDSAEPICEKFIPRARKIRRKYWL